MSAEPFAGSRVVPVVLKTDLRVFERLGSGLIQTTYKIEAGRSIEIEPSEELNYDHRDQSAAAVRNFNFPGKNPETAYVLMSEYEAATK